MRRILVGFFLLSAFAFAQHEHHMAGTSPARLSIEPGDKTLTVTLGPLNLPANTTHDHIAQPAPQILEIPFDGWITAYHPSLVTTDGQPVPGRLLHHVAFWNTNRADFLCPNKDEHIFGAGGEMNDWPALPGFGYRVHKGDRIRITTMFHNPTDTSYPNATLKVKIEYAATDAGLKSVYPAWFDVKECGESDFPLAPGGTHLTSDIKVNFSGRLLGVGGHMHDYGERLVLNDTGSKQPVARLDSTLDEQGHIRSMPIVTFVDRGGYALSKGSNLQVVADYGKPRIPHADGMAIVVGYFLPDNDADMATLARKSAKP